MSPSHGKYTSAFSERVRNHPLVAEDPNSKPSDTSPLVLAAKDQLLVSRSVSADVLGWLDQELKIQPTTTAPLSSLFLGTGFAAEATAENDVALWQLDLGQFATTKNAIFDVFERLREGFPDAAGLVSPNHVLIPESNGSECPYGPPSATSTIPPPSTSLAEADPVTVIDCGYYWDSSMGHNPLDDLCQLTVIPAKWWNDADGMLEDEPPEDLGVDDDETRLSALAGHANFVAGVIAQHCKYPTVTVWTHNGGFRKTPGEGWKTTNLFVPTEHSVARSLLMSQQESPTGVICMGFAFPAAQSTPGPTFASAMGVLGDSVVVVPAGNHGDHKTPRFPGALRDAKGDAYPNIIAVGGMSKTGKALTSWSDSGSWVDCSAIAEHVESTFLHVSKREPEDWEAPPNPDMWDFANSWATWNGTCFAAPKVAAAIAVEIAAQKNSGKPGNPVGAWKDLAAKRGNVTEQYNTTGALVGSRHGGRNFGDLG